MPSVSVILPAFNRAGVILRSVYSVLNQSFKDLELIVVDDCSTDDTREVLKTIKDERLKLVFLEKNQGACFARNVGLKMAQGAYIAFQDSDDEWLLEKLDTQINTLKTSGCLAICSSYLLVSDSGETIQLPAGYGSQKSINVQNLLEQNLVGTPTLVVARELLKRVGNFDERLPRFQDWELAIRIAKETPILFTQIPTTLAHSCANSISKNQDARIIALEIIVKKHFDLFLQNKKILALYLRGIATHHFLAGENGKALSYISKALQCKPYYLKTLFCYLFFNLPLSRTLKLGLFKKITGHGLGN